MDKETTSVQNHILIPVGLQRLYEVCRNVYPNQPNPLQVSAVVKYWLGGPDPLDYISMYANHGVPELNIPPHWHYVSYGLSDLHGDGRVHQTSCSGLPSGFGFELTFRLKRSPSETAPPTWPATLMQCLAKYVFNSGNTLCVGDHVSWHSGLDGKPHSKIHHILLDKDPQLPTVDGPCGTVEFVQIVGICKEELEAAQKWNGFGVLNILKKFPKLGGEFLVTDMSRSQHMFELDGGILQEVENGIIMAGSNLSGVSCHLVWSDRFISRKEISNKSCFEDEFIKTYCPYINLNETDDLYTQKLQSFSIGDNIDYSQSKEFPLRLLDSLHLILNEEAGHLLPLVASGRLKHGRHFTFKSTSNEIAVTFVAPDVTGSSKFVNSNQPFALYGSWLQIYIAENFLPELEAAVDIFNKSNKVSLPKTFYWPCRRFAISVISEN
ncbi:suppressor of fused homolog [Planococcus citri]|uniref:suppressor of fused homolog n=1 Tax=Planococcus citri TaxID=170843 RepID=UPI0031F9234D